MSNALKFLAGTAVAAPLFVDDVFQSYVRTGTSAEATITTNIDMTKGYMLWSKGRSGATDHAVYDSARGVTLDLVTNNTAAQTTQAQGLKSVSTTGHTIGTLAKMNTSAATYVDWVFRKAAKFFDVVTYTGTAGAQTINHSLGAVPGMILVKVTSTTGNWWVWHRSYTNPAQGYQMFNLTDAVANDAGLWGNLTPTSTSFKVGASATTNSLGETYVAYIFAHDTSADGIIQCGSFTTDASGNATVNLGWEPQYLIVKVATGASSWHLLDVQRGMSHGSPATSMRLYAESTSAESSTGGTSGIVPTATGFENKGFIAASQTLIYLAIRRPNKPPTSGTQVYNTAVFTGNDATRSISSGFSVDLVLTQGRTGSGIRNVLDRLRGKVKIVNTDTIGAEVEFNPGYGIAFDQPDGVTSLLGTNNASPSTYAYHFFRRAPGVFDEVCYRGASNPVTVTHGLGVVPELIIIKARGNGTGGPYAWPVYSASIGNAQHLILNTTAAATASSYWNTTTPTASVFSLSSSNPVNDVENYIAYLFATLAGISKVGSYTGNGSSLTVNCGFSAGARFILIKRTDSTGDWYIWDTVRGIIAGSDPHLSLNTTAAEVITDDSIDPDASGFIVNQLAATNINVTSATYIFLAIA